MDSSAIKRIEELADRELPETDVPAVIVPEGCKVESLEQFFDRPKAMRQEFRTERLQDFLTYVEKEAHADDSAVFVRPDGDGATAVIDFGRQVNPLWGRHRASLSLRKTPEFQTLVDVCDTHLSQRGLTDWLEDWHHILTPRFKNGEESEAMPISKAIAAIRRVKIEASASSTHEHGNFNASQSSMEQVEARSGAGDLPSEFLVHCPVYPETAPRGITVRMQLLTGDDKPRFRLRIMRQEQLMKDVSQEIEQTIAERLSQVRVFVGDLSK